MPLTMQHLKKIPALVLLTGAVFLMQKHAWDFWSGYDATTGWLWALMLEGAALWLWAQRNVLANGIALLATLLVLAGPLYQVSKPAVEMLHQSNAQPTVNAERKAELKADKTQLTADLATYNENSKHRAGWATLIATTKAELKAVNAELKTLSAAELAPAPMAWQALAVIVMQAVAMLIFQIVIIQSIRELTALNTSNTAAPAAGEATAGRRGSSQPNQPDSKPAKQRAAKPRLSTAA